MKPRRFLICLITLALPCLVQGRSLSSIQNAFDRKFITAKATCNGGLSLSYAITNKLKDSLVLMLPAGWRFNSDAGKTDYQDILVTKDQLLVLPPLGARTFTITGFCCEADKACPAKNAPYTAGKLAADSSLLKLALFLNQHTPDHNATQYAVWAISNNRPTAHITSQNDSVTDLVRRFVAGLKHETLPDYTVWRKAVVGAGGLVQEYPMRLKASLVYSVGDAVYGYLYVLDGEGQKVGEILGRWLSPGSGSPFAVDLNLRGLKTGRYTLILETAGGRLSEKEIVI